MSKNQLLAQFTVYMDRTLHNSKVNYWEHKDVVDTHESLVDEIPEHDSAYAELPFGSVEALEEIPSDNRLYNAIRKLSQNEKTVLTLSVIEERPVAVIARTMGISESGIYKLRHTALIKLRAALERRS
ncbi:sigma-70 family RNA polymerase sigma factor [Pseudoflavonifractor phocaeensis]|uniref:sigma-70 family RNA polymerase sigma factor n=1 Tax=Pseudoflavonifractor phocaeensis TaxID=1870988 RepID=UPI0021097DD9|nr:sigma-70 family RNA polymerase sigma factor [Pseudoflavonifractor phocaeensis]MCQ4864936.1 sigma-70 family RNA polymerase sigma factor [Pseudoflavonifractor phocaeensis]